MGSGTCTDRCDEDPSPKAIVEKFATPGVVTIAALTRAPFNVPAEKQIKTLVYIVQSKPVLILMRGDDQLNEAKLAGAPPSRTRLVRTGNSASNTFLSSV